MPYKTRDGSFTAQGTMYAPPSVTIKLGDFKTNTVSNAYWKSTFSAGYLLYYTRTLPSVDAVKGVFKQHGIEAISLNRSLFDASFEFYDYGNGRMDVSETVHKGSSSGVKEGRDTVCDEKGYIIEIIDVFKVTPDTLFLYESLKAEIGDHVTIKTAINPQKTSDFQLEYSLPLTIEAFTKCKDVLNNLIEQGYLTREELNELRAKAVKSVDSPTRPGVILFEPSAMPPIAKAEPSALIPAL